MTTLGKSAVLATALLFATAAPTTTVIAAEPMGNQTEGQALLGGAYIGMAAECNFPTAPLENAMDYLFDNAKVGPLEKARLQGVMMKGRELFHTVARTNGCATVKRDINDWFGAQNIPGFNK